MLRLWMRMIESYGHRWTSQYGEIPAPGTDNPAMATWARGLSGLPPHHIALGLDKCIRAADPWPPSLPAFRALCAPSPSDFGLPAAEAAWAEAREAFSGPNTRRNWSHPAVRMAVRHLRREKTAPADRPGAFKTVYRLLCQRVMDGTPLADPLPAAALPQPAEPPASPEEARRHLATLKALAEPAGESR